MYTHKNTFSSQIGLKTNRNGKKITVSRKKAKKLTVSRKKAKILTVNRKSHYPIETLVKIPQCVAFGYGNQAKPEKIRV